MKRRPPATNETVRAARRHVATTERQTAEVEALLAQARALLARVAPEVATGNIVRDRLTGVRQEEPHD